METYIFKQMIAVIRAEEQRRASLLETKDQEFVYDFAYDQWIFYDEPFINELCLMVLVTLNHQVERELVDFAARAADDGKEISRQQYQEKVKELRNRKGRKFWEEIENKLKLDINGKEYKSIKVLRLLANAYKHDHYMEPDKRLLDDLNLEKGVPYASLPESNDVREGLAAFIDLGKNADFCDIAEGFVDIASNFLENIRGRIKLSPFKGGPVSLFDPKTFAR